MTAPLSIIIPTLNAEKPLLRLLPQLYGGLTEGLIAELIFADGGSTDQTMAIAEDAGAQFIKTPQGRGTQLRDGCAAAKGRWLLILHADSRLPQGWEEIIADHMANHPKEAAVFRLKFDDSSIMAKVTARWANLRSRLFKLPYGDQGLLIPSALYHKRGGYDAIPLMEDVAMAKKLRGHVRLLDDPITTSAAKYRSQGWLRRGARNLVTLMRYKLGTNPDDLARSYHQTHHKSS